MISPLVRCGGDDYNILHHHDVADVEKANVKIKSSSSWKESLSLSMSLSLLRAKVKAKTSPSWKVDVVRAAQQTLARLTQHTHCVIARSNQLL